MKKWDFLPLVLFIMSKMFLRLKCWTKSLRNSCSTPVMKRQWQREKMREAIKGAKRFFNILGLVPIMFGWQHFCFNPFVPRVQNIKICKLVLTDFYLLFCWLWAPEWSVEDWRLKVSNRTKQHKEAAYNRDSWWDRVSFPLFSFAFCIEIF